MPIKRIAFSLVELIAGLIIISITLAVFAPIINKKVRAQSIALDAKLTEKCSNISSNCQLCQGTKYCIQCKNSCPVGTKLQTSNCSCIDDNATDNINTEVSYKKAYDDAYAKILGEIETNATNTKDTAKKTFDDERNKYIESIEDNTSINTEIKKELIQEANAAFRKIEKEILEEKTFIKKHNP